MELGRELFESKVFPLGPILTSLTGSEWFWIETEEAEHERRAAVMVEEESSEQEAAGSGNSLLQVEGDESSVAVGEADPLADHVTLFEAMQEFESILRKAGRTCNDYPDNSHFVRAQKALYRCVDILARFNNGH